MSFKECSLFSQEDDAGRSDEMMHISQAMQATATAQPLSPLLSLSPSLASLPSCIEQVRTEKHMEDHLITTLPMVAKPLSLNDLNGDLLYATLMRTISHSIAMEMEWSCTLVLGRERIVEARGGNPDEAITNAVKLAKAILPIA